MDKPIYLPGISINVEGKEGHIINAHMSERWLEDYARRWTDKEPSDGTLATVLFEDGTIATVDYRRMKKGNKENIDVKRLDMFSPRENFYAYLINDKTYVARNRSKEDIDRLIIEENGRTETLSDWTEEKRKRFIGEI